MECYNSNMSLFRTPDFRTTFVEKYRHGRLLDLGCGGNKTSGATGVDHVQFPGVDVVHDLNQFPYPFSDAAYDAVVLNHIIEHVENIPYVLREVHRLLREGGETWIATPHFSDSCSWIDTTHRFHLSLRSFIPFCNPPYDWFDLALAYVTLKGRWKEFGYERYINRRTQNNQISKPAKKWEDRQCFTRRGGEMFFILRKCGDTKST